MVWVWWWLVVVPLLWRECTKSVQTNKKLKQARKCLYEMIFVYWWYENSASRCSAPLEYNGPFAKQNVRSAGSSEFCPRSAFSAYWSNTALVRGTRTPATDGQKKVFLHGNPLSLSTEDVTLRRRGVLPRPTTKQDGKSTCGMRYPGERSADGGPTATTRGGPAGSPCS